MKRLPETGWSSEMVRLFDVARDLAYQSNLRQLMEAICQATTDLLGCDRATIFLYDSASDELKTLVALGTQEIRIPSRAGIAGSALHSGQTILVPDAYSDSRFNRGVDTQTGYRTRDILAVPLKDRQGAMLGVLQALNKHEGSFTERDELLGNMLGFQVAVALERQHLTDRLIASAKVERELEVARDIQQSLLPKSAPVLPGYDLACWYNPADLTGGDFLAFQTTGTGRLAFCLADVSGHGIGPSLVVAECRGLFRSALSQSESPDQILDSMNQILCEDLPDDRFVTGFVAVLKPDSGNIHYVSAAQGPLLLYRAATQAVEELTIDLPPLGLFPDLKAETIRECTLEPGDVLVVLTDGFYEWHGSQGHAFGPSGIRALLPEIHELPAQTIIETLYKTVAEHGSGVRQPDDLTAVILKRTHTSG